MVFTIPVRAYTRYSCSQKKAVVEAWLYWGGRGVWELSSCFSEADVWVSVHFLTTFSSAQMAEATEAWDWVVRQGMGARDGGWGGTSVLHALHPLSDFRSLF